MDDRIESLAEQATEMGELRRRLHDEQGKVGRLAEEVTSLRAALAITEAVETATPRPPKWLAPRSSRKHTATACLLLTDTHLDEVVSVEQTGGLNRYDREVAMGRLERAFTGAVRVSKDILSGMRYDGAVLLLGGDIISGEIHQEYLESNEGTTVETLLHWLEPLAAGINLLAEEFGKLHVVGVVGNHGRRTIKPRYKNRVVDNYDWLLYRSLEHHLASDERITWQFPQSLGCDLSVYDVAIRLEHGDEARGGSGIAAAMSPLLLLQHRRQKQYGSADRDLDLLVMGHWHRRHVLPGLLVGGTLKGVDEHTLGKGYDYAPPSQEFFVVSPERGIILNAPIWVQDRSAEGW